MPDCIFCKIVAGEIPSARVWEDDQVIAFLDINPLAEGHTLIVPRSHAERLTELSAEQAAALFRPAPALAAAVLAATGAQGFNVLQNNGRCSGQAVGHVHVHIIPRVPDDGLGYRWPARPAAPGELDRLQKAIRAFFPANS
jgi:histidine triad (HIT) family protein